MKKLNLVALTTLALLATACGEDSGDEKTTDESDAVEIDKGDVVKQYSKIVYASMQDSVEAAEALHEAAHELIEHPSQDTLDAAREAWLAAREPYLQTEVYRFYNGPIEESEGMINAWPLDELYIDYGVDAPNAGIINDAEQEISADALIKLNEQGGEENIATGFHAIEFLLWGQDVSEDGPGDRPFTDFVSEDGDEGLSAARRAAYLSVVADLLVSQLSDVANAWKPDEDGNFRAEFEAGDPDKALSKILTGMYVLSGFETGGERLETALQSGDQNDEHSCFSDNTHRDMIQDVQGVLNVWKGSYETLAGKTISGDGIGALVKANDPDLFAKLDKQIKSSLAKANALVPPFDLEIAQDNTEGRERVDSLIQALHAQETSIDRVARLLKVEFIPQE